MSQPKDKSSPDQDSQPNIFVDCISNSKQIFELIDRIIPLEICLHHQVLPLELKDELLTIGMVNSKDRHTIDFLRPIVSSQGYYFRIESIDAQTHQLVLSAYLKRPAAPSQNDRNRTMIDEDFNPAAFQKPVHSDDRNRTMIDEDFNPAAFQRSVAPNDRDQTIIDENFNPAAFQRSVAPNDRDQTIIDENFNPAAFQRSVAPNDRDQTIIDENFNPAAFQKSVAPNDRDQTIIDENFNPAAFQKSVAPNDRDQTIIDEDFELPAPSKHKRDLSMTLTEMSFQVDDNNLHNQETLILEDSEPSPVMKLERDRAEFIDLTSEIQEDIFDPQSEVNKTLDVKAEPIVESQNFLAKLSHKQLWQELLTIILKREVDTLILKTNSDYGSIFSELNRQKQSILERVNLNTFTQLLNEIKVLAKLAPIPLEQPKKVAIEKVYNGERILLRLEFILARWGEEVIVQILRGELLESYEQKQMDKMLEQALALATKLEKTLKKMRICANYVDVKELNTLQSIQQEIDLQLQLLSKKNTDFGDG